MTWVKCPECGSTVYDDAVICPNCNCPIGESIPLPEKNTSLSPGMLLYKKFAFVLDKKIGLVPAIIIVVAACIFFLLALLYYQEYP